MQVHSLYLYPVKSLAGIRVSRFELDDFGPAGDRRWMIVDDNNQFVSQRRLPQLARITTSVKDGQLCVAIPGEGEVELNVGTEKTTVVIWRDQVEACVGTDPASSALSHFCDQPLRFVYMPESSFRRVDPGRVAERRRVGFADGFPLLVTNLASLDELNSRLEYPVDIRRFRPNVVITGAEPWAEDRWRRLLIGVVGLTVAKPCSRCVVTTVDPDSGEKNPNTEPLKTLSSYRRTADGVIFGQNAVHDQSGTISVGDTVVISEQES